MIQACMQNDTLIAAGILRVVEGNDDNWKDTEKRNSKNKDKELLYIRRSLSPISLSDSVLLHIATRTTVETKSTADRQTHYGRERHSEIFREDNSAHFLLESTLDTTKKNKKHADYTSLAPIVI